MDDVYHQSGGTSGSLSKILSDEMYKFDALQSYRAVNWLYRNGQAVQAADVVLNSSIAQPPFAGRSLIKIQVLQHIADNPPLVLFLKTGSNYDEGRRRSLFSLANPEVVHPAMGFESSEGKDLFVGELSAGTQGVFSWILYAALKLADFYDFVDGWERQPGILIIDEIENNLHPTWQRRVIPTFLEHFPNVQLFASTHSPFVVAGLKAGQVHLLNRDENGVVTATTNTEDIIGWTADEILRTMMGVDDPTDDATAAAASELRQLRNEGPQGTRWKPKSSASRRC